MVYSKQSNSPYKAFPRGTLIGKLAAVSACFVRAEDIDIETISHPASEETMSRQAGYPGTSV